MRLFGDGEDLEVDVALGEGGQAPLVLVDHIINSSELEWQEKPTFYAAVLLEFAERMREILS